MLAFVVCILFAMSAFSQSSKTTELLYEGVKTKDYAKIESALSKRASVDDGLLFSVMLGDSVFVKYFIQKGASPTYGLVQSIKNDNLPLTRYLIAKGARFEDVESIDFDGTVKIFNKIKVDDFIPVEFVNENGEKCWMMKDEKGTRNIGIQNKLESGYYFVYHTKKIQSSNPALMYAIANNNLSMVKFLLQNGASPVNQACINVFEGYTSQTYNSNITESSLTDCETFHVIFSKSGQVETDRIPFPPVSMRPIEYAILTNADIEIVRILQNSDTTKNFSYDNSKIVCSYENNCDSLLNVETTGLGIVVTKKKQNDNVFGVISISVDKSKFKEINLFPHNEDFANFKNDFAKRKTRYFYNELDKNVQPKEIDLKINLKQYEKSSGTNTGSFIDKRDGRSYKFVKIGTQIWMAQNLIYKIDDSFCHSRNNDSILYNTYGRIYTFEMAKDACPPGWHLPSVSDWEQLINYLGGKKVAPDKMKEEGIAHWELNKTGTNSSGFTALPAGFCSCPIIGLDGNGVYGAWLAAEDGKLAFLLSGIIMVSKAYSGRYYSIRCLKD